MDATESNWAHNVVQDLCNEHGKLSMVESDAAYSGDLRKPGGEGAVQGEYRVRGRKIAASAQLFTRLDSRRVYKCLPFLKVRGCTTCWSPSKNKSER